jgi:tetratricopeptide (TPR) repeat protein
MPTAIDSREKSLKENWRRSGTSSAGSRLHALGLSALNKKNFELAASKFAEAIHVAGPVPQFCQSLAAALYGAGRLRQSATCYEQAIAGNPGNIQLYFGLARVLIHDGRTAAAVTVLKHALTLEPNAGEGWALLGGALHLSGQDALAAEALQQAVYQEPGQAAFHFDLGLVLCRLGDLESSEAAYRRALQVNSRFTEALNNLGNLLRRRNAAAEAVACFRRALRYRPGFADAKYNLGLALQDLDLLEDAESCYQSVLEIEPAHHAASNNYANVLMGLGRIHEALSRYEHAVRLAPANREYRVNAGMAQLLTGDFGEGWRNYSARVSPSVPNAKQWTGQPLKGSSILLLSEQGRGDTIQFIRYARQLRYLGGRVRLHCPADLVDLLRTTAGLEQIIPDNQAPPSSDWYAPMLHLPAVFGTRIDTIPAEGPYLSADPERVRNWGFSLSWPESHLRIGIAWRGGPDHWNDRNRSMDPASLSFLSDLPSTTFISLQKGCREGYGGLAFLPLPRELGDFADTAALMAHLDLVISVDTSVAHLAGSLGRPAWVLLPFAPDWRWMRERRDSPWYPGMRLFRQERRGDWRAVMEKVREALVSHQETGERSR